MSSSENEDPFVDKQEPASLTIDDSQGRELLRLARSTIDHYLRCGKVLDYDEDNTSITLATGLFVTLWGRDAAQVTKSLSENRVLRGCIGHLQGKSPLFDIVQEVAIGAATRDPRFPPLTQAEFDTIRIEIAILSPLRMINELQQIEIGQDGLLLEGLGKRGLLLPKVAERMGWDRESFLKGVCSKAGLPLNSWPGTCKLYAFTTVVFDEAKMELQQD